MDLATNDVADSAQIDHIDIAPDERRRVTGQFEGIRNVSPRRQEHGGRADASIIRAVHPVSG